MRKNYETVFILTPILSEQQTKDTVQKFTQVLTDKGATILNSEEWGLKKLAYPIQKKSNGFYVLIEFEAEPSVIDVLETEYRRDERIIRFLTTVLDKFSLEYNEKRRSGKYRKATPETAAATPVNA
jgi:small subunit ribosomal protein S6